MSKCKRQVDGTTRNRQPAQSAFTLQIVGKPEVELPHLRRSEIALANHQQQGGKRGATCTSIGLLAMNLPLLPGRLQLPVPYRVQVWFVTLVEG